MADLTDILETLKLYTTSKQEPLPPKPAHYKNIPVASSNVDSVHSVAM